VKPEEVDFERGLDSRVQEKGIKIVADANYEVVRRCILHTDH